MSSETLVADDLAHALEYQRRKPEDTVLYRLAFDQDLCSEVLRIFVQTIFTSLRRRTRETLQVRKVYCGAVTFLQRSRGSINLNPHYHLLIPDGVYIRHLGRRGWRASATMWGNLHAFCPFPSRDLAVSSLSDVGTPLIVPTRLLVIGRHKKLDFRRVTLEVFEQRRVAFRYRDYAEGGKQKILRLEVDGETAACVPPLVARVQVGEFR